MAWNREVAAWYCAAAGCCGAVIGLAALFAAAASPSEIAAVALLALSLAAALAAFAARLFTFGMAPPADGRYVMLVLLPSVALVLAGLADTAAGGGLVLVSGQRWPDAVPVVAAGQALVAAGLVRAAFHDWRAAKAAAG